MQRLIFTYADGYTTNEFEYDVIDGRVKVTLPPTSVIVLKAVNPRTKAKKQNAENRAENAGAVQNTETGEGMADGVAVEGENVVKNDSAPDAWEVASNIYGKQEEIVPEEKKGDDKKKRFPFF